MRILSLARSFLWQSKRDKIIKIQTQRCKSTNFAYGRMQKVKVANSRVQSIELHMEGWKRSNLQTQKCHINYKVQSQKYSIY